jgi:hypothetical protein
MAHHLSGIHSHNKAPIKKAAGEGRVSFFLDFECYSINFPDPSHSKQSEEIPAPKRRPDR